MFKKLGADAIEADEIYRQILHSKGAVYKKIISTFGAKVLKKNRQINKKELSKIVFSEKKALRTLGRIAHPAIISRIKLKLAELKRFKSCQPIIIEAPLLIEGGLIKIVDKLIVVKTDFKRQLLRSKKHWKLSKAEIIARIKSQLPLAEKLKLADYVVDNNGTLRKTEKQVEGIWKQETEKAKRKIRNKKSH